jgi:hypothetical protein
MSLTTAELRRVAAAKRRLQHNISEVSGFLGEQSSQIASTMHDMGGIARQAKGAATAAGEMIRTRPLLAIGGAFVVGWLVSAARTKPRETPAGQFPTGSITGLVAQGLLSFAPAILDVLMTEVLTRKRQPDTF